MINNILHKLKGVCTVQSLRKNGATVGNNVTLFGCFCSKVDATCLQIGNNVNLTRTTIITHDAALRKFLDGAPLRVGRVVIGDNVFIGSGTIILPNSYIGSNVIIGAGSVVTRDIPDNSVAVGNPCRVICSMEEFIEKNEKRIQDGVKFHGIKRGDLTEAERIELNKKIDRVGGYIF